MKDSESTLTIVELRASNVKRLRAVKIRPDGGMVVLGGKNGAGKSSVLDAITYALAGERSVCREPVRRGEEKAQVDLDLGEFKVRRTFTKEGGGTLTVLSKDGARYPSPQAMLDKITGRLSFDPLAFAGMESAKQSETLRSLVGLDFSEIDGERARTFALRTTVNADGKALRARFDAAPSYADAPAAEASSADILAEQGEATKANAAAVAMAAEVNRANESRRSVVREGSRAVEAAVQALGASEASVAEADEEVKRWGDIAAARRRGMAEAERILRDRTEAHGVALGSAKGLVDASVPALDLSPFAARLAALEATNAKVRANQESARLAKRVEEKRAESAALTARIEAADKAKADAIAAAKMPVAGLGFDAGGVTLNGFPLDQSSHAERLRVSVAIGLAMNPRLKVLLIRDASLLDEDGMRLVAEMAEAAGAQFWLERVGKDEATTVLIEDGSAGVPADATVPA